MNPLQLAGRYLQGSGSNRAIQTATDYALGAALGASGQQVANMVLPGTDPNPLLSGLLAAPLGAAVVRGGRALVGKPELALDNVGHLFSQLENPYEKAALLGSGASLLGSGATSLYNTATNGADYDNNLIAAGVGSLAAVAPIAASLINRRRGNAPTEANVIM